MKRLRFKTPFNGMDNALKLIPESYKVNGKEFELTDGIESYRVRWEKTPTILKASNKNLMNEDMQKMKHLMQYNSKDTLGNLRGKERIDENKVFNDVWNKTKSIDESSAFGFGFNGEGNLEENEDFDSPEEENEETKVIDILKQLSDEPLTKKQQQSIKDTIEIMKKYNKSDDKIEEDSTDGEDGHEAPELKNDDSGAR
tara:strand:- start:4055 stop:4651 length:597 start_codon:yes stop_codon:yes gene_type:complete